MDWELVVVWNCPHETVVYGYESEECALNGQRFMLMANGNQIEWTCVRPKIA